MISRRRAVSRRGAIVQVTLDEIQRRIGDPSLVLVNVLARDAFAAERIPGSRSLPLAELPERAAELLPERDADIVVYCAGPT